MNDSAVAVKSFDFATRIVKLYKYLSENKKEYVLSKQLLRSGTSVVANVSEGERAQSKADFISKMSIALKEANETEYWIRLLHRTGFLTERQYQSLDRDLDEIIRLLVTICKRAKTE